MTSPELKLIAKEDTFLPKHSNIFTMKKNKLSVRTGDIYIYIIKHEHLPIKGTAEEVPRKTIRERVIC